MRDTVVVTAAILIAALVGLPSSAQSQVVIIIGNGAAQPYYPPPYPHPYPYPDPYPQHHAVYGEAGYYSAPGYVAPGNGYYNGYYSGYYSNGYYRPYRYGW